MTLHLAHRITDCPKNTSSSAACSWDRTSLTALASISLLSGQSGENRFELIRAGRQAGFGRRVFVRPQRLGTAVRFAACKERTANRDGGGQQQPREHRRVLGAVDCAQADDTRGGPYSPRLRTRPH